MKLDDAATTAEDLATVLRYLREQSGLSLREMAERIGCPASTLHCYEMGEGLGAAVILHRAAEVVGREFVIRPVRNTAQGTRR